MVRDDGARQYSGTAGRIENSQIGVFLTYATPRERTFVDCELYLPKAWTEYRDRCRQAGIGDEVEFATRPELAIRMLRRAHAAGVPAGWVSGDVRSGQPRRPHRAHRAGHPRPDPEAQGRRRPAYFDRPGTSNGPTEAINGRLEHLRGSALGFRNLTNYIARALLESGGFRPQLHPRL